MVKQPKQQPMSHDKPLYGLAPMMVHDLPIVRAWNEARKWLTRKQEELNKHINDIT